MNQAGFDLNAYVSELQYRITKQKHAGLLHVPLDQLMAEILAHGYDEKKNPFVTLQESPISLPEQSPVRAFIDQTTRHGPSYPEDAILEAGINGLDAYNDKASGIPPIGTAGLGFFTLLPWLVNYRGSSLVVQSKTTETEMIDFTLQVPPTQSAPVPSDLDSLLDVLSGGGGDSKQKKKEPTANQIVVYDSQIKDKFEYKSVAKRKRAGSGGDDSGTFILENKPSGTLLHFQLGDQPLYPKSFDAHVLNEIVKRVERFRDVSLDVLFSISVEALAIMERYSFFLPSLDKFNPLKKTLVFMLNRNSFTVVDFGKGMDRTTFLTSMLVPGMSSQPLPFPLAPLSCKTTIERVHVGSPAPFLVLQSTCGSDLSCHLLRINVNGVTISEVVQRSHIMATFLLSGGKMASLNSRNPTDGFHVRLNFNQAPLRSTKNGLLLIDKRRRERKIAVATSALLESFHVLISKTLVACVDLKSVIQKQHLGGSKENEARAEDATNRVIHTIWLWIVHELMFSSPPQERKIRMALKTKCFGESNFRLVCARVMCAEMVFHPTQTGQSIVPYLRTTVGKTILRGVRSMFASVLGMDRIMKSILELQNAMDSSWHNPIVHVTWELQEAIKTATRNWIQQSILVSGTDDVKLRNKGAPDWSSFMDLLCSYQYNQGDVLLSNDLLIQHARDTMRHMITNESIHLWPFHYRELIWQISSPSPSQPQQQQQQKFMLVDPAVDHSWLNESLPMPIRGNVVLVPYEDDLFAAGGLYTTEPCQAPHQVFVAQWFVNLAPKSWKRRLHFYEQGLDHQGWCLEKPPYLITTNIDEGLKKMEHKMSPSIRTLVAAVFYWIVSKYKYVIIESLTEAPEILWSIQAMDVFKYDGNMWHAEPDSKSSTRVIDHPIFEFSEVWAFLKRIQLALSGDGVDRGYRSHFGSKFGINATTSEVFNAFVLNVNLELKAQENVQEHVYPFYSTDMSVALEAIQTHGLGHKVYSFIHEYEDVFSGRIVNNTIFLPCTMGPIVSIAIIYRLVRENITTLLWFVREARDWTELCLSSLLLFHHIHVLTLVSLHNRIKSIDEFPDSEEEKKRIGNEWTTDRNIIQRFQIRSESFLKLLSSSEQACTIFYNSIRSLWLDRDGRCEFILSYFTLLLTNRTPSDVHANIVSAEDVKPLQEISETKYELLEVWIHNSISQKFPMMKNLYEMTAALETATLGGTFTLDIKAQVIPSEAAIRNVFSIQRLWDYVFSDEKGGLQHMKQFTESEIRKPSDLRSWIEILNQKAAAAAATAAGGSGNIPKGFRTLASMSQTSARTSMESIVVVLIRIAVMVITTVANIRFRVGSWQNSQPVVEMLIQDSIPLGEMVNSWVPFPSELYDIWSLFADVHHIEWCTRLHDEKSYLHVVDEPHYTKEGMILDVIKTLWIDTHLDRPHTSIRVFLPNEPSTEQLWTTQFRLTSLIHEIAGSLNHISVSLQSHLSVTKVVSKLQVETSQRALMVETHVQDGIDFEPGIFVVCNDLARSKKSWVCFNSVPVMRLSQLINEWQIFPEHIALSFLYGFSLHIEGNDHVECTESGCGLAIRRHADLGWKMDSIVRTVRTRLLDALFVQQSTTLIKTVQSYHDMENAIGNFPTSQISREFMLDAQMNELDDIRPSDHLISMYSSIHTQIETIPWDLRTFLCYYQFGNVTPSLFQMIMECSLDKKLKEFVWDTLELDMDKLAEVCGFSGAEHDMAMWVLISESKSEFNEYVKTRLSDILAMVNSVLCSKWKETKDEENEMERTFTRMLQLWFGIEMWDEVIESLQKTQKTLVADAKTLSEDQTETLRDALVYDSDFPLKKSKVKKVFKSILVPMNIPLPVLTHVSVAKHAMAQEQQLDLADKIVVIESDFKEDQHKLVTQCAKLFYIVTDAFISAWFTILHQIKRMESKSEVKSCILEKMKTMSEMRPPDVAIHVNKKFIHGFYAPDTHRLMINLQYINPDKEDLIEPFLDLLDFVKFFQTASDTPVYEPKLYVKYFKFNTHSPPTVVHELNHVRQEGQMMPGAVHVSVLKNSLPPFFFLQQRDDWKSSNTVLTPRQRRAQIHNVNEPVQYEVATIAIHYAILQQGLLDYWCMVLNSKLPPFLKKHPDLAGIVASHWVEMASK